MDDIKLAMLGNREAAKRLTDAGVLVPCPWCGNTPTEDDLIGHWQGYTIYHQCKQVGPMRVNAKTRYKVCLAWNTRAPILSAEEMEMLERLEKEAGPCLVTLDEVTEITQEQWEQLRSRIKRREADSC